MKIGSVNHDVRINNGLIITNTIFRNPPMTKQELAAKVGLSLPTVSSILNSLQESGLVTQGSKQPSTGGRPAQRILPNYGAAYSIGAYLSPNHARFCLTDLAPDIVAKKKYAIVMENTPEYWQQVHDCLMDFKQEFQIDDSKLLGVGFALSSPSYDLSVGGGDMITVLSGNQRISLNVNHIQETFADFNIAILSDAKMAALAQRGGRSGAADYIYLSVNNNIGGAIVLDGEVVAPEKHNAEFGHMIVDPDGRQCVCGMLGCFDAYCSATSLQTAAGMTLQEFFDRLEQGDDERLARIWDEYLRRFTIAISNLRVIFEMDIIVGGILSQYLIRYQEELMQRFLQQHAAQHSLLPEEEKEFLYISDLGEFSASMGTSLTFIDKYLANIIQ